jgi:hypothetical protein
VAVILTSGFFVVLVVLGYDLLVFVFVLYAPL